MTSPTFKNLPESDAVFVFNALAYFAEDLDSLAEKSNIPMFQKLAAREIDKAKEIMDRMVGKK